MQSTARAGAAVLALVLLAPVPLALAGGDHAPRAGDAGLYRVVTTREGSVVATEAWLTWEAESILVPGGEGRTFATVSRYLVASPSADAAGGEESAAAPFGLNPGKDYAARDSDNIRQRGAHVTEPGGALVARTTTWIERESDEARAQWMHRVSRAEACDLASVEALLAATKGLAPERADAALAACGARVERDGAWMRVAFADGASIGMAFAPGVPVPLAWSLDAHGAREEATLLGWQAGDSPLPRAAPLDAPARVKMVEWSAEGPLAGDLPDHPFREAQRALSSQDADARAFFATHDQARVLYSTHAWAEPTALVASEADGWQGRIRGVPCGAAPIDTTDGAAGLWTIGWAAPRGSLFAIVERASVGGLVTLERPVASSPDDYSWAESGEPATRAPAPEDLARHLHALDAFTLRGVYSLDYAFVPTVHGAMGAAAVSRGTCERDLATGRLAYQGVSMWFVDGVAQSIVGTTIHRDDGATALAPVLASLSPPPPNGAASPTTGGLTLAAGAAIVAAGVAAALVLPRALQPLYSRIHKGTALDSERRARLYEAIVRRPGARIRDLAAALGIATSTAEHHARILRRLGYVRRVRAADGVAYYPSEHPRAAVAHVMDRAHADALLDAVVSSPDASQQELAAALQIGETHLSELLRDLEREGLVERQRDGRRLRVRATPKAQALRPRA